jgi:hypothetical protein
MFLNGLNVSPGLNLNSFLISIACSLSEKKEKCSYAKKPCKDNLDWSSPGENKGKKRIKRKIRKMGIGSLFIIDPFLGILL